MSKYILPFLWAIAFLLSLFGNDIDAQIASLSAGAAAAIAAGGVVGGFINDYMNARSQADTNLANREIAKENREWQSKENQIARQWSERQWNLNNQYNTPSAIAQRQREAGFNPYLLGSELGQGQSVPAQANTTSSAPGAPQMVAAKFGSTAAGLQNAGNTLMNYSLQKDAIDANSANQRAQADAETVDTALKLKRIYGNQKIPGTDITVDQNYVNNRFKFTHGFSSENSLDYREGVANVKRAEAEANISEIRAGLEKEFGRQKTVTALAQIDQSITESAARIGKMASDAKLNDAQIKTESQKFWTEVAKQFNLRKQGEYYVASANQINLLKGLVAERMELQNVDLSLSLGEHSANYEQKGFFRSWQSSDEGKSTYLTNQKNAQNVWLNGIDRVIHTISPITPSIGYKLNDNQYSGLGYD